MGKNLIIKGADFSENAVDVRRTYFYNVPNSQFISADADIAQNVLGVSIVDQSPIQGKTIYGMRMNVATPGIINIFKSSVNGANNESLLTSVATAQTSRTGIQDIDFSTPVTLGANEYLVLGSNNSTNTLVFKHHTSTTVPAPTIIQTLYYWVGRSGVTIGQRSISLNVDFYYY